MGNVVNFKRKGNIALLLRAKIAKVAAKTCFIQPPTLPYVDRNVYINKYDETYRSLCNTLFIHKMMENCDTRP